jgi:glycosyltransferase involved in cell wall biosynthesis
VRRLVFVVGTTTGGTGRHVGMLAAGCAARGMAVEVIGPSSAGGAAGLAALPAVTFTPVEFGSRPRLRDAMAVLRLRQALGPGKAGASGDPSRSLGAAGSAPGAPDVVHAHGMRAGALAILALAGARARRPPIVVTVHNAPPHGGGAAALIYRVLEHVVARGADLVLCVSGDLEQRMRAAGARRVARAIVPAPDTGKSPVTPLIPVTHAAGRPIVLAVGRLAGQKGLGTLLEAAASWRDMAPEPLLLIAGDGPLAAQLRARAAALGVGAEFLGHRDDVPALLAAAAVFVLPSWWEGQPFVLQEALRAGVPIVATRTGGIPGLTGDDAAILVPPGDCVRLASTIRAVLRDPALAARLRAAARRRGAGLPSGDDAVAAALACYAGVLA